MRIKMTNDEAEKIAKIISTVDGGCAYCIDSAIERLNAAGLGWQFERSGGEWKEYSEFFPTDDDRPPRFPIVTVRQIT